MGGQGEDLGSDSNPLPPPCHCGSGGMAELELDAAHALADLSATGRADDENSQKKLTSDSELAQRRFDDEGVDEESSKAQLNLELGKVGVNCYSMKQNPTEGEKEAKRLRRVLANRESARQTIRRRQTIREELTRKVSDLSSENENMKLEKEMTMKVYHSLKDKNKQLKDQMANTKKTYSNTRLGCTAPPVETPSSSTMYPVTLYGAQPLMPYVWRSWPTCQPCGGEQGNPTVGGPFCLPPCAWFYPLLQDGSSSREHNITPELEKKVPLPSMEEEEVVACPLTLAIEEEEKETNVLDKEVATSSAAVRIDSETNQHENFVTKDSKVGYSNPGAKLANAAAADARKRRKEITKLKLLHGRNPG
ncbi:uncharacterized protein [Typha angustifolia]|uniref:uncharacterized protein isoform X1 n=1 Tax=Typha angustifolia TaxID=59011 RepID=UPI003C30C408